MYLSIDYLKKQRSVLTCGKNDIREVEIGVKIDTAS